MLVHAHKQGSCSTFLHTENRNLFFFSVHLTVPISRTVEGEGWRGVSAAVWPHHADGQGTAHMLTEHYMSLSTSLCSPVRNINVPNSICRVQSYFLDEQCQHVSVMDD